MTKPIQGKDGKFLGSVGEGKSKVPTPAPPAANSVHKDSNDEHLSYEDKFNLMKKATGDKPSRVENGVTWTEVRRELRSDGWTIIDETTTGTYTGLKGEGYSGVKPQMAVEVRRTQWIRPDGTVRHESYACNAGGAGLSVNDPENDLRLDGSTQPQPATRAVTSLVTAGAAFRIYRHTNADGSGYTWSADGTFRHPTDTGVSVDVPDVWAGPNGPSERDLQEAAQRYRDSL